MLKESKEKDTKAKVPNAFEVNPAMMQALADITPENIEGFLMSNPQIVPEKFRKDVMVRLKNILMYSGGSIISGVVLNMMLTRMTPKILILPKAIRLPIRLAVLAIPVVGSSPIWLKPYRQYQEMMDNQFMKIQRLRKTGNIQEYFA